MWFDRHPQAGSPPASQSKAPSLRYLRHPPRDIGSSTAATDGQNSHRGGRSYPSPSRPNQHYGSLPAHGSSRHKPARVHRVLTQAVQDPRRYGPRQNPSGRTWCQSPLCLRTGAAPARPVRRCPTAPFARGTRGQPHGPLSASLRGAACAERIDPKAWSACRLGSTGLHQRLWRQSGR